jgi:hypothetical protein
VNNEKGKHSNERKTGQKENTANGRGTKEK